jgi:hypothetical protein
MTTITLSTTLTSRPVIGNGGGGGTSQEQSVFDSQVYSQAGANTKPTSSFDELQIYLNAEVYQ